MSDCNSRDLEWLREQGNEIPEPSNPGVSYVQHLEELASAPLAAPPLFTAAFGFFALGVGVSGGMALRKTTPCGMIIQRPHDHLGVEVYFTDADVRLAPRIRRDMVERSRDMNSILEQDIFYRGSTPVQLGHVHVYNSDHPDAFDTEQLLECVEKIKCGHPVHVPIHDFKTHQRCLDTFLHVNAYDVIILEGILVFHDQRVGNLMNMKVFVDTDTDVRLARRIRPDIVVERGRDINSVLEQASFSLFFPTGVDFCPKLCGVSDTRRCESMGNACYKGIKIGKIKRHKGDKFVCGGASNIDNVSNELTSSEWRHTAKFRGAGLVNRHSHCYVNVVIQCLLHTAEFFQAIVSDTGSHLLCTCGDEPGIFCLPHCLRRLFNQLTSGDEVICPLELTNNLSFFTPSSDEDEGSDEDNSSNEDYASYDPRFYRNIEHEASDEDSSSNEDYASYDPRFYRNTGDEASDEDSSSNEDYASIDPRFYRNTEDEDEGSDEDKGSDEDEASDEDQVSDEDEASDEDEGSDEDEASDEDYSSDDPCFYMKREDDARRFLVCLIAKLKKCHDESAGQSSLFKSIRCHEQASPSKHFRYFNVDYGFKDRKLEYALQRLMLEQKKPCKLCKPLRVESCCTTKFTHAPEIAIFVLRNTVKRKRKFLRGRHRRQRLSFPMFLDLTPFSTGKESKGDKMILYDLYAVIVHKHTSKDNGHFYALAHTHPNLWFEFDDKKVSRVEKEDVLEKKPCVLFYARKGSLWFSDAVVQHDRKLESREADQPTNATLMQLQPPRRRRFPIWRPFSLFFRAAPSFTAEPSSASPRLASAQASPI